MAELLPSPAGKNVILSFATPVFNTVIGFISAISGPIIFLSVLSGILAIGDISTLKSAGLRIVRDTLVIVMLTVALSFAVISLFYDFNAGVSESGSSGGAAVMQMILDIVPTNFFDPFLSGNSMQIIFIAVITGAAMLTLSAKIKIISDFIFELQSIVQQIMVWVNSIMPLLVFVTILHVYFSGTAGSILESLGAVASNIIIMAATILFIVAFIAIRYKASFASIFKKLLPTMIIAGTTNSSSAAFLTNTDTCRNKLGVDSSLVDFGVPFGQVICMPGIASTMACVTFSLASYYDVNVNVGWVIVAVIGVTLVSVAVPPIPGGGLAAYAVLFGLLGIPAEGLAVAIPIEMIMEYPATAIDLAAVQLILVRTADKLKILDLSVLRRKK